MASSSPKAAAPDRLLSLDVLRGLMALAVAAYHLSVWSRLTDAGTFANHALAKFGNYGVESFFLISGFCFFLLYGPERLRGLELARFYGKRFFRIAPLYYVAVALNLAFALGMGPQPSPRMLAENATLSFGLFHPNHALVTGGWCIGLEFVFYLAFPLLAWLAARWRGWLPLLALLLLLLSLPHTLRAVPEAPMDQKFHAYVQVFNHGFLFLLGGLLAQLRGLTARRLGNAAFWILCGLVVMAFLGFSRHFYDHFAILASGPRYLFLGLTTALVALFAFHDLRPGRIATPLAALGDLSYALYLMHPFAHPLALRLLPAQTSPAWSFALAYALALGMAFLARRFVERPGAALGKRFLAGR